MLDDGQYACALLVEMTLFCMYLFGMVFLFSPHTEISGFITLACTLVVLLVVTTYNTYRAGAEDLIAFSLFASVGLSLVGVLFCVFFFNRVQSTADIFGQPSLLDGLPRDILTLFKTILVPIFLFTTVLTYMYLHYQQGSGEGQPIIDAKAILQIFFAAMTGAEVVLEDKGPGRFYIMTGTVISCVLLALTAYNVYVANLLKSIVLLS